jgi:integrase
MPSPLSDAKIKAAKKRLKAYTIGDGNSLYLKVTPEGARYWLSRPTNAQGKRTNVHLGRYPEMSLAEARAKNGEVLEAARLGAVLPTVRVERALAAQELTEEERLAKEAEVERKKRAFLAVSNNWLADYKSAKAYDTYRKAKLVIERDLQPDLAEIDMGELTTSHILKPVRALAARAPELAKKAVTYLNGIVELAILEGYREDDRVLRTKGVLPSHRGGHHPAVTKERLVGHLMRTIHSYPGFVVRSALQLASWTAMRPGVIATAKWAEMDLERQEWHVDANEEDGRRRMKTGHDHIMSLPTQAIDMLEAMRKVSGGDPYVFPAVGKAKNPHLHRDALSKALRDSGLQGVHTTHGFRATLRTLARERLQIPRDVLEAQLAHAKADEIQAAYDRTTFDDERKRAMQKWADYLDRLRLADDAVSPGEDVLRDPA